jgi:hypothetical protein
VNSLSPPGSLIGSSKRRFQPLGTIRQTSRRFSFFSPGQRQRRWVEHRSFQSIPRGSVHGVTDARKPPWEGLAKEARHSRRRKSREAPHRVGNTTAGKVRRT